jgi:hypothetical protein
VVDDLHAAGRRATFVSIPAVESKDSARSGLFIINRTEHRRPPFGRSILLEGLKKSRSGGANGATERELPVCNTSQALRFVSEEAHSDSSNAFVFPIEIRSAG